MEQSTAQTIVKVFAILGWIGSAFAIIAGLAMLVIGPMFLTNYGMGMMGDDGIYGGIVAGLAGVMGVIFIALGIFGIFVGRGLWQHKNWARIITLIFAVLSVLGIFSGNFLGAIIGALEIWLFGFEKTVVGLFTGVKPAKK